MQKLPARLLDLNSLATTEGLATMERIFEAIYNRILRCCHSLLPFAVILFAQGGVVALLPCVHDVSISFLPMMLALRPCKVDGGLQEGVHSWSQNLTVFVCPSALVLDFRAWQSIFS